MIELKNVRCKFIFNDGLNLKINKGEFVVIIGDNGAGKSSLINLISGNLFCLSGQILIDGMDFSNKKNFERSKYISHVFQDFRAGTNGLMSVRENLSLALNKNNINLFLRAIKKENDDLFKNMIDLDLNKKVDELSGGQRQKLSLIMAIINKPKILLLDEHTAALDPVAAKEIMEFTNKIIKENNLTAVMVTHNLKMSAEYGDRLIFMRDGKIKFDIKGNRNLEDIVKMFE